MLYSLMGQLNQIQFDYVAAFRSHSFQHPLRRWVVEVNACDGRRGTLKDNVFHLLNVDVFRLNSIEHAGKHTRSIAMANYQTMGRRGLTRQVYDIRHFPGLLEVPNNTHRLSCDRLLRLVSGGSNVMSTV